MSNLGRYSKRPCTTSVCLLEPSQRFAVTATDHLPRMTFAEIPGNSGHNCTAILRRPVQYRYCKRTETRSTDSLPVTKPILPVLVMPQENLRMMKKVLLLTALVLVLPFAAFAGSSVDFTNNGGPHPATNSGLTVTGSTLSAANGLGGGLITGSNLGTVSFSTGMLTSGTLQIGGAFAAGCAFSISGNGTGGIPNGVIFNGSFTGPVTWTLITLVNGPHNYTLTGSLTGTWYAGGTINGATVQLTINTGRGFF